MTKPQNPAPAPMENSAPSYQPVYGKRAVLSAWLSLAIGYLYCRSFFVIDRPFFAFWFTIFLFLFAFTSSNRAENLPRISSARALFYPISALFLNLGLLLSGAPLLRFFTFVYSVLSFLLFCHLRSGNRLEQKAGKFYFFDLAKAVLFAPFTAFIQNIVVIISDKRGKKLALGALFTLCGLLLALVPSVVVLALLSFDSNFTSALESILDFCSSELLGRLFALALGIPFGMYFFGAVFASNTDCAGMISNKDCQTVRNTVAFCPSTVGVVALVPLLFIYGVFIFAQKSYYASVLSGTLPESHTFSSFARDGFFRLIAVAVINLLCLLILRLFTKKNKKGKPTVAVTLSTVLLSLVTVVLCATALSQMGMYVSAYGLTRLRLYALWFMALLAIVFLLITLCRLIPKISFAPIAIPVFLLCFALLALPDSDSIIAKHNYNCYKAGKTTEFDAEYLKDLGDSAIPTLCTIANKEENEALLKQVYLILAEYEAERDAGFKELSLPLLKAKSALGKLDETARKTVDTYKNIYHHAALPENADNFRASMIFSDPDANENHGVLATFTVKESVAEELTELGYLPYKKADVLPCFDLFYDLSGNEWKLDAIKKECANDKDTLYLVRTVNEKDPSDGFALYIYLPTTKTIYTLTYFPAK